jgi:hypothetical protein
MVSDISLPYTRHASRVVAHELIARNRERKTRGIRFVGWETLPGTIDFGLASLGQGRRVGRVGEARGSF